MPSTISMAQSMTYKIHVLLVDHDTAHHIPTIETLEYLSYKVTTVSLASTALSILTKGKPRFDLLMENINSPDSCGFELLQRAVEMELPVMYEDDVVLTKRAIEDGAFLCIKKPISMEIAKYIWQHVVRMKIARIKENGQQDEGLHTGFEKDLTVGNMSDDINLEKNYRSKKKVGHPKFSNPDEESNLKNKELGEGRCYPKEIHELMNVPGLTRMQVTSHLQKCLHGAWEPHNDRKSKIVISETRTQESNRRVKPKIFRSMPHLGNNSQGNNENNQDQDIIKYTSTKNNVIGENRELSLQEGYHLKLPIEPHNSKGYNSSSHVGIQTLNLGQLGQTSDMDDVFMFEEQFVFDAESVTSGTDTSLQQRKTIEDHCYDLPNTDCKVDSFSVSQQEPRINYSGSQQALDLDPSYSNQMLNMLETITTKWNKASKSNKDIKTQG